MASKPNDYEKKMIDLQLQMRQNQVQMEDYFLDLDRWTKEIKDKEKKVLENPETLKQTNKGLPPIRSLEIPKKKKKVKKSKENQTKESNKSTNNKKLNSYDYRAWDKLDVDKLCQEVDERKTSSSEYTTDEEWEEEQRKVKAEWEKERGNHFFKDNMLNEAINCYTQAIQLDPTNAVYPANRAMCLIKQEKYGAAEVDCSLAISLDQKYSKAYHRRATTRIKLGKNEEAIKDYEYLLKLEPNNKLFQTELNKLEQMIESRNLVFPIVKKEEEKSKKPFKRIMIQEINDESTVRAEISKTLEEINQKVNLTSKEESLFQVDKEVKKPEITILENKFDDLVVDELEKKTDLVKPIESKKEIINVKETQKEKEDKHTIEIKKTIPNPPTNGYQFKKDWQLLGNNINDLAKYFKKISPNEYSKLFLNGLESESLSKILLIFRDFFKDDPEIDLYKYMKCLSQVKRFQTQFMFLTSNDKKAIEDLIDHLRTDSKLNKGQLNDLINLYKF